MRFGKTQGAVNAHVLMQGGADSGIGVSMYEVKPFQANDGSTRYQVWRVRDDGSRRWVGAPDGFSDEATAASLAAWRQMKDLIRDSLPLVIEDELLSLFEGYRST